MLDRDRYSYCLDQADQAQRGGRPDEALGWLEEALRANPHGSEARNTRGELLWDAGRTREALHEFVRALEIDPHCVPAALNHIEIRIEEYGEYEDALDLADVTLEQTLEPFQEAEVYYLKSKGLFYLDDLDGALFLLRRAMQVGGESASFRAFEGQILLEMARLTEAKAALERALGFEPGYAHALYYLAHTVDHLGDHERAERLFAEAARDGKDYPLPVRIDDDEFESIAREAVDSLPAHIKTYIENCPIVIEELPPPELIRQENVSPLLLGLFQGVPATEPGASPTLGTAVRTDLDRMVLFKRNLETYAESRPHLLQQIQITVKHEIGHYLGLDEDELDRLGLG